MIELASGFFIFELYPHLKLLQLVTGMKNIITKLRRKLDLMLENIINKHRSKMATHNGEITNTKCILQFLLGLQQQGEYMLEEDSSKVVLMVSVELCHNTSILCNSLIKLHILS